MKVVSIRKATIKTSVIGLWAGRILSSLCTIFFLIDALMKLAMEPHHVESTMQLGYPENHVPFLGMVLLLCTLPYMLPRTAPLGAILLTGYLGGATATMVHAGEPVYFPLLFGMAVWAGVYLKDEKLRNLIHIFKD